MKKEKGSHASNNNNQIQALKYSSELFPCIMQDDLKHYTLFIRQQISN